MRFADRVTWDRLDQRHGCRENAGYLRQGPLRIERLTCRRTSRGRTNSAGCSGLPLAPIQGVSVDFLNKHLGVVLADVELQVVFQAAKFAGSPRADVAATRRKDAG